jgi:hypothetical protein
MNKKQYIKMTDLAHNNAIEQASKAYPNDYGVVFNAAYDAYIKGYEECFKKFINKTK